jgi:hypothetical protein
MASERNIVHFGMPSIISAFEAAIASVRQYLRPDTLGFPSNHRIYMPHGLVDAHGCVNPAHDDWYTKILEVSSYFIGAVYLRCESGNTNQVGPRHVPNPAGSYPQEP